MPGRSGQGREGEAEILLAFHSFPQTLYMLDALLNACNSGIWEVEAVGLKKKPRLSLATEFEASMGYMTLSEKIQTNNKKMLKVW